MLMFDLWKLTLPIGGKGKPKEIYPIGVYADENFYIEDDFMVMVVPENGVTTPNSKYPRCELREVSSNGKLASWSTEDKMEHSLSWQGSIDELPMVKSEMVFGQIHDANDDVLRLKLVNKEFAVMIKDVKVFILDDNYQLGTLMSIEIACKGRFLTVTYNGKTTDTIKFNYPYSGCYFKVGNYQQGKKGKSKVKIKNVVLRHMVQLPRKVSYATELNTLV